MRIWVATISSTLPHSAFQSLLTYLEIDPPIHPNPERAIYSPLLSIIQSCLPQTIYSIQIYSIKVAMDRASQTFSMKEQMQITEFLGASQDMKDQLTTVFANSATRQSLHYIRAQENTSFINSAPAEQQIQIPPVSPSLSATLSARLSNLRLSPQPPKVG